MRVVTRTVVSTDELGVVIDEPTGAELPEGTAGWLFGVDDG